MMNIADLDSGNGKTYREVNNEKNHLFGVDQLVEIKSGVRLFVAKLSRDCDGTPLYSLSPMMLAQGHPLADMYCTHGYSEDGMKAI